MEVAFGYCKLLPVFGKKAIKKANENYISLPTRYKGWVFRVEVP